MILHRPGCDVLDRIVRDLAFVLHHHEIEVQSPLLEMSNIDAEGGIASFIQRNIHQSNFVIILITESVKGLNYTFKANYFGRTQFQSKIC